MHLKSELMILVPLLIGFGQILKNRWLVDSKKVPWILLAVSVFFASLYGLGASSETGWRFWVDGLVMTGLAHGAVAAFSAMGIFDLGKSVRKEAE